MPVRLDPNDPGKEARRDRIAIAAMSALISSDRMINAGATETTKQAIARTAYEYADAMLYERAKGMV